MGRKRVDFDHFVSVKKKYRLLFELNQKFLLYKLWGFIFLTTCIEGFFLIFKSEDVIFFYGWKICRLQLQFSGNRQIWNWNKNMMDYLIINFLGIFGNLRTCTFHIIYSLGSPASILSIILKMALKTRFFKKICVQFSHLAVPSKSHRDETRKRHETVSFGFY